MQDKIKLITPMDHVDPIASRANNDQHSFSECAQQEVREAMMQERTINKIDKQAALLVIGSALEDIVEFASTLTDGNLTQSHPFIWGGAKAAIELKGQRFAETVDSIDSINKKGSNFTIIATKANTIPMSVKVGEAKINGIELGKKISFSVSEQINERSSQQNILNIQGISVDAVSSGRKFQVPVTKITILNDNKGLHCTATVVAHTIFGDANIPVNIDVDPSGKVKAGLAKTKK